MNTDYDTLLGYICQKYSIKRNQADCLIKDWLLTEKAIELLEADIEKQLEG